MVIFNPSVTALMLSMKRATITLESTVNIKEQSRVI